MSQLRTNCPKCGKPKVQTNARPAVPKLSADALYLQQKAELQAANQSIDAAVDAMFAPPAPSWFFANSADNPNADPRRNPSHYLNDPPEEPFEFIPAPTWFFKK